MILSAQIKNYYYGHLSALSPDKQFHFATRMAAWSDDDQAFRILHNLKNMIVDNDDLRITLRAIVNTPQSGRRNAHELRQPFFDTYPLLFGAHAALFRLRHLKSVYNTDARNEFFDVVQKSELDALYQALNSDHAALRVLSTFAVNFMYLYKKIALQENEPLNPQVFMDAARGYDARNATDMQLKIYLYTHCIIGDSNFYTQQVPAENLPIYTTMLQQLEQLITENFEAINLDNKLEFLVCARIISFKTSLFERIDAECQQSLSPEGDFVIDVLNTNIQENKTSFDKSEHRNVLYIMSATEYAPHSTVIH